MSSTEALAVVPDRRPVTLATFRNSHGWGPSIWGRLLKSRGLSRTSWVLDDKPLLALWHDIDSLPDWQQIPLILTFDTGVIPYQEYKVAADLLDEFDRRLPAPEGHANHVPAMAEVLRGLPEAPFVGVYGTSVSENPFDPWRYEEDDEGNVLADEPGSGIPLSAMYVLERHRVHIGR